MLRGIADQIHRHQAQLARGQHREFGHLCQREALPKGQDAILKGVLEQREVEFVVDAV